MALITTTLMDCNLFLPFLIKVQRRDLGLDDLDEQKVISLLTDVIEKLKKENQELHIKQVHVQVM